MNKTLEHSDYLCKRIHPQFSLAQLESFPSFFEIETVHDCNARCKICPALKYPRPKGIMNNDLFHKIICEISEHSDHVQFVKLFRDGEPFLDPYLEDRVLFCKKKGIRQVSITTNMSLATEERSRNLLDAGLDVVDISIDGFTAETYEGIRCGLKYEQVVQNTLNFIKIRNNLKSHCTIRIRMILLENNKHEWNDFKAFWKKELKESDVVMNHPLHNWGNQLSEFTPARQTYQTQVPCIALWSLMPIFADGTIPMCNVDFKPSFKMGNALTQSIEEIWQSEQMKRFRGLHMRDRKQEISLCAECNAWDEPAYD